MHVTMSINLQLAANCLRVKMNWFLLCSLQVNEGKKSRCSAASGPTAGHGKIFINGPSYKKINEPTNKILPPVIFLGEKRWKNGPNIRVIAHRIIEN